jgi:hypothetical protein
MHQLRLGPNYKVGEELQLDWSKPLPPPPEIRQLAIHAQTTFVGH